MDGKEVFSLSATGYGPAGEAEKTGPETAVYKGGTSMRFAFLIMGKFDSREDQAVIHNGTARIIGVSDLEDAARTAKRLEFA